LGALGWLGNGTAHRGVAMARVTLTLAQLVTVTATTSLPALLSSTEEGHPKVAIFLTGNPWETHGKPMGNNWETSGFES
jgi:hypothetical protein